MNPFTQFQSLGWPLSASVLVFVFPYTCMHTSNIVCMFFFSSFGVIRNKTSKIYFLFSCNRCLVHNRILRCNVNHPVQLFCITGIKNQNLQVRQTVLQIIWLETFIPLGKNCVHGDRKPVTLFLAYKYTPTVRRHKSSEATAYWTWPVRNNMINVWSCPQLVSPAL